MDKKTTYILHLLLAALVTLTGAVPANPALAAIPTGDTAPPRILPPGGEDRGEAQIALTQDAEAIDPGPWRQQHVSLAGDSAGNLSAVWEDYRDDDVPHVRFAYRPTGGAWETSLKLDPTGTQGQTSPTIGVDGSGNSYAVWIDARSGVSQVYFAYRPAGGPWGGSQAISPTAQAQDGPALAVNRRGEAVVAWLQGDWGAQDVFAAVRPVGGPWDPAEQVNDTTGYIWDTDVALDDWGRAYVIWTYVTWTPVEGEVLFATRPLAGPWGASESVRDSTDGTASEARIAVDGSGNVHAVWGDSRNSANGDTYSAYRPAGGPWSVNVRLNDDAGDAEQWEPAVAVDGAGNGIAVWVDWRDGKADLYTAVRPGGGAWGPNALLVPSPIQAAAATHLPGDALRRRNEGSVSGPLAPHQWWWPSGPNANPGAASGGSGFGYGYFQDTGDGDHNVHGGSLPGTGAGGNCHGAMVTLASAHDAAYTPAGPAISGMPNFCHTGNGGQEPTLNGDQGFIGPPGPPSQMSGYTIQTVEVDGQTVYIVRTGSGADAIYSDLGDAERFGQEHATPPLPALTFDPSDIPPDIELLGGSDQTLLNILGEAQSWAEAQAIRDLAAQWIQVYHHEGEVDPSALAETLTSFSPEQRAEFRRELAAYSLAVRWIRAQGLEGRVDPWSVSESILAMESAGSEGVS